MREAVDLDDIRIAAAKLSDENKKYVIDVAQTLLFTQRGVKSEQDQSDNGICPVVSE